MPSRPFLTLSIAALTLSGAMASAAASAPNPEHPTQPAVEAPDSELEARIERFQARFDQANRLSGVLLIARGDRVILHRAYGMADRESGTPNTLDTRFAIASINKIMTSVVFSRLIMEGAISQSDTVDRYIPDFPRGDRITLEHLARHTSGLPHRVTTNAEELAPTTSEEMVTRAARATPISEPGESRAYSSTGYSVLARCLEIASNTPYAELLRTRIFEPAGMESSVDPNANARIPAMAKPYVPARGELWPSPGRNLSFLVGAGSVVSTAEDLLRFTQALRARTLDIPLEALSGGGAVAWSGATDGWFSFVDIHPQDDLTIIWTGNSWGGCAGALRAALPAMCRDENPLPQERPEILAPLGESQLAEYTGLYQSRPGATSEAVALNGELVFADSVLLPIGPDLFWHQPWHCEVAFRRDEGGQVVAFEAHNTPSPTPWPRVASAPE